MTLLNMNINWNKISRPNQRIPEGNWQTWLLLAGRGFGKTRAGAEAVLQLIENGQAKNVAICGETILEAEQIMVNGTSGILTNSNLKYKYWANKRKIVFENGAICQIFGVDKYEKLRGFEFDLVWIDELAKFKNGQEVLDQISLCLRIGICKMIITTTPRNKHFLLNLMCKKDIIITRGTSYDNENLSQEFFNNIDIYKDTNFGKQEIYGEIVDRALWNKDDIQYKKPSYIKDICIGIDPAVEYGTTGIIVSALNEDNEIIVLEDKSVSALEPKYWMQTLQKICAKYKNATIAVEINQGGQLIDELLSVYNIDNYVVRYRATKSKMQRNLYSHLFYQSLKVYHSVPLELLEKELLESQKDRADALHWCIYHFVKSYNIDLA